MGPDSCWRGGHLQGLLLLLTAGGQKLLSLTIIFLRVFGDPWLGLVSPWPWPWASGFGRCLRVAHLFQQRYSHWERALALIIYSKQEAVARRLLAAG